MNIKRFFNALTDNIRLFIGGLLLVLAAWVAPARHWDELLREYLRRKGLE